jgi:phage/plasmid-associated DNA primase
VRFISHLAAPRKETAEPNKLDGLFSVLTQDVDKTLVKNHKLCEVLAHSAVTKVYLDKDIYVRIEKGQTGPSERLVKKHEKEVLEHVQALIDMLESDDVDISYVIATRHGPTNDPHKYKLSFRPFLLGCEIRYTEIPAIIQAAQQEEYWDMTVYKASEQLLAAIHGCKGATKGYFDARILEMEIGHDRARTLDYVAQHTDPMWPLLDLSHEFVKAQREAAEARRAKAIKDTKKMAQSPQAEDMDDADSADSADSAEDAGAKSRCRELKSEKEEIHCDTEFVRGLVACLNADSAADRTTWLKVAFGLKAAYGMETEEEGAAQGEQMDGIEKAYFDAWIDFSKKATGKFKGPTDCRKTWDSIKTTDAVEGGIKIGTLCFYAARDNPARYKEIQRKHQKLLSENNMEYVKEESVALKNQGDRSKTHNKAKEGINKDAIILALRTCSTQFQDLPDTTEITQQDGGNTTITFDGGREDLRGTIQGKSGFTVHDTEGTFMGTICKDVVVPESLGFMHTRIPDKASFKYNRASEKQATLVSVSRENGYEEELKMVLNNMLSDNAYLSFEGLRVCAKNKVDALQKGLLDALNIHARRDFNIQQNICIGMLNVNVKQSEFASIRVKLLDLAQEQGLRKLDGFVYERVPGCPCAFRQKYTYKQFINSVLEGDEVYLANPKRFDEAIKFMENYEVKQMPELVVDKDLISFANGILELSSQTFTRCDDMRPETQEARVARHHIDMDFDGSTDTPLLDKVLDFQFDKDVAQVLCAMLGRLLFHVNKLDGWQVMPYLVGVGGTGKSLVLAVAEHMYAPGTVAYLAPKREDVFGMANACEKDLVVGRDMPAKLSGSLPQELMQAMTSGDGMEIPRKGTTSLNVTWKAPVIMASNHMPDYVNSGNNVGRRIVTLRFDSVVTDPEEGLLEKILEAEMPQIIARCLGAYQDMRARVKATKGGFWKAVPKTILEWQGLLASATNKLHAFLSMEDDERGCKIEKVDGQVTTIIDFKAAYEACMAQSFVNDVATFHAFGFRVSDKPENVCKTCKQVAKARGGRCCEQYSQENRSKRVVLFNMRIRQNHGDTI